MIHVYTGNGKGKTTSAFGLAMRASGQGLKVIIFQFLKPKGLLSGEEISAKRLSGLKLVRFEQMHPMFGANRKDAVETIKKDFGRVEAAVSSKRYDMVVLDEIVNVVDQGFVDKDRFLRLLKAVPKRVELVLTGRGDISDIEQYADYITVMRDTKHPFRKRKIARKGIEY